MCPALRKAFKVAAKVGRDFVRDDLHHGFLVFGQTLIEHGAPPCQTTSPTIYTKIKISKFPRSYDRDRTVLAGC